MSRMLIRVPAARREALGWVGRIVLGEMLGLPHEIADSPKDEVTLEFQGRTLTMPSLFPNLDRSRALWGAQIPVPPLASVLPETLGADHTDVEGPVPVLFGRPEMEYTEYGGRCGVDLLGGIFFMLSRFEEVVVTERDRHDRFPAVASVAWKAGFLYRPLVDEYVALLWGMLQCLWPGLERRLRHGTVKVTCDVDYVFEPSTAGPGELARAIMGDLGRSFDTARAGRRVRNYLAVRRGDHRLDPNYTFEWYMDRCERHGRPTAFYFIPDHSAGRVDGLYHLTEPRVLDLIRMIAGRGHEIGMHGSYNTFRDPHQMQRERTRLLDACRSAGVEARVNGNRQHFLRWDAAETPDHLTAAGFDYDTSGTYADRPGFRYGTAHPFPMWSWRREAPLPLRQQPLIAMEASALSAQYLGLGHSPEALDLLLTLRRRALAFGGDFILLWHNSYLTETADRDLFDMLIG